MSTSIDQKAYLQKYLTGSSGDRKKKKKKAVKGKGFQIIDDDIDLSKLRPLDGDELDVFDEGEDAPQIAGIIDDRPEELKQLEQLKTSSKWKVVNQDDGFTSKLNIEEIKKDIKETEKDNELIFGKMYSDSEGEKKNDSDPSPPRKHSSGNKKPSKPSNKHNSDSDFSPPRKNEKSRTIYDSDPSPRNNKVKERVRKPSRWGEKEEVTEYSNQYSDHKRKNRDSSPKSRKNRRSVSSDVSPPRRSKKYDSDESPPRKSRKDYKSPPRKSKKDETKFNTSSERFPPNRRKHSPQRQNYSQRNDQESTNRPEKSRKTRHSSDSDLSPPRKNKYQSPVRKQLENNKRKYNDDSDASPPRREKDRNKRNNESPPPSNKKMAKTLEGKLAGLQDARQLRQENDEFRRREEEVFKRMTDEVSGRNAKAVSRKSKRETSEERQKQSEKAERQKVLDEKYKKWSRGLKQLEDQETRVQEFMHEASKPLARHKGDRDLEHNLKQIERAGDPMLQYIKEKKRERGELGPEKPAYKGSFPPNRFNIRPGYRWDGVDRSNGYEKKFFEQQSKRKAQEEEAYKWSTEDL